MIERYAVKKIQNIWSLKAKYKYWLSVTKASSFEIAKFLKIPTEKIQSELNYIKIDKKFIKNTLEIEKTTKHDLNAFVFSLNQNLSPEAQQVIHYGLTSSDIIDTAQSLQCKDSLKYVISEAINLKKILTKIAIKHKNTPMPGRSHGIHGEPISFGFLCLAWLDDITRHIKKIQFCKKSYLVGQFSGSMGNFVHINPSIEKNACNTLGLKPAPHSTQIISRDYYANIIFPLVTLSACLEKIAINVRALQRTEINELNEGFTKNQSGSSSMPHKKNPITSENLCGLARVMRSKLNPIIESIALWEQRDISNSSVERLILPDTFHIIAYMLKNTSKLLKNLVINQNKMLENIENSNGIIFSQYLMSAMIKNKCPRKKAYRIIQDISLESIKSKTNFLEIATNNNELTQFVPIENIKKLYNKNSIPTIFLKNIDQIYEKLNITN